MLSEKMAVTAVLAGILTAVFSSAINSVFETFVTRKDTVNFREIINRSLLTGCTLGWLIGVIFYAFALTEAKPIKMIITYSMILGVVAPGLSSLLIFAHSKLFSKNESS